jgi:hypothetical protein
MKKVLLTAVYISLLVLALSPSIFASWPPPGGYIGNRQPINQPPVLNSDPWGVPAMTTPPPYQYVADVYFHSYSFSMLDLGNIMRSMGDAILGFRFGLTFIYWNSISSDYETTNISARILYH